MRNFLPDYNVLPVGSMYRPLYRLFAEESWRQVFRDKKPVNCATAGEALRVAKERVKEILNTRIRVEHAPEIEQDVLGIEEWRKQREEAAATEIVKVFGGKEGKTIFVKGGRQVQVEKRRRKA